MSNNQNINNLIGSSIGTGIAEIVTLPINTVKSNYQKNLNYKSASYVAKKYL